MLRLQISLNPLNPFVIAQSLIKRLREIEVIFGVKALNLPPTKGLKIAHPYNLIAQGRILSLYCPVMQMRFIYVDSAQKRPQNKTKAVKFSMGVIACLKTFMDLNLFNPQDLSLRFSCSCFGSQLHNCDYLFHSCTACLPLFTYSIAMLCS